MQNKKLVILIILGVAAILSLAYGIITPAKTRRQVSPKEEEGKEVTRSEKTLLREQIAIPGTKRRAKRTKFTSWKRNPFMPVSASASTNSLTGILWDEKLPKAIIGDEVVGIQDKVGAYTVVDIKPDKVILNDGSKNFELLLEQ